jgi:hypothetical protein
MRRSRRRGRARARAIALPSLRRSGRQGGRFRHPRRSRPSIQLESLGPEQFED